MIQSPKKWIKIFVVVTGILLSVVLSISYLIDPFSLRSEHQLPFAREIINRKENVALWALCETNKIEKEYLADAQLVILGDSRARLLTNHFKNHRRGEFGGKKVYNLCIGGCSLEESISIYGREKARGEGFAEVETVIIVLSLIRFCEPGRPDRVEQSARLVDFPIRYYLNDLVVRRAMISLFRFKTVDESVLAGGDDETVMRAWMKNYSSYDKEVYQARLKSVAEFAANLEKQGVRLILYFPPGAGGRQEALETAGLVEVKKNLVSALRSMGEFHDLADKTEILGHELQYVPGDPIHHDQGDRVLEFLLNPTH